MQLQPQQALFTLKHEGLVLFPTDTYWCIGCDATSQNAVNKLYTLKQNSSIRAITCFVADDRMLSRYVTQIPYAAQSIIEVADTPTTIIYDAPQNVATNLIAPDNTIAIRIPDDEFCYQLSRRLNGAIATTTANFKGTPTPKSFKEITPAILKGVDYIVNLQKEKICTTAARLVLFK